MPSRYQKRHYEDVAGILQRRRQERTIRLTPSLLSVVDNLADDFQLLFAADNPLFDRERFLKACGLEGSD